ncbi:DUF2975 domain-containing protein [Streptomyces sp. NBC_01321]|uniref:hypothetical protein n=1 Tax=Streptomyces sp. NBC_01321 TaxID=2903825 RepID=UPI002E10BDD1|nr:DUF2975 domain-containing protein [Streptomyces sp. NBC_01321]
MTEDSKLLEPLSTVVSGVLRLLTALLVAGFILSLFDTGVHLGWGGADVCVTSDSISGGSDDAAAMFDARAGVDVMTIPRYCASPGNTYQRFLDALGSLPSFVLLIGGLFLLNRLLRGAARDGVHHRLTAQRLRRLGWWLLCGSLAAGIIEANARAALSATLTHLTPFSPGAWLSTWTPPYLAILAALGLLTFARIVRAGVTMREELEGTV